MPPRTESDVHAAAQHGRGSRTATFCGLAALTVGLGTQAGLVLLVSTPLQETGFRAMGVAGAASAAGLAAAVLCTVGALLCSHLGSLGPRGRWTLGLGGVVLPWLVVAALTAPALGGIVSPEEPGEGPRVTVLVQNLWYANEDPARTAREILDAGVDVMVLLEYTPEHHSALAAAGAASLYPHSITRPRELGQGIAVMSRLPIGDAESLSRPEVALEVPVQVGDRHIELVAIHPTAPSNYWGLVNWRIDYDGLIRAAADFGPDVVVAGDFNATHHHRRYRQLLSAGHLRDAVDVSGAGLSATWPVARFVPPVMRLDRILVGEGIGVADAAVTPEVGSDHLGVRADLVVRAP